MNTRRNLLLLALSAFALTASADTFTFSYSVTVEPSGISDAGSGTLTATYNTVDNDYLVTDISGATSAFGSITGLLLPGSYEFNDNLLSYPGPYLNGNGISFTVSGAGDDGSGDVNLFYDSISNAYYEYQGVTTHPGTLTVTPVTSGVPEPGSAALLLFGASGIGVACWRRNRLARG